MKRYIPLAFWIFSFSALWALFRTLTVSEAVSELIAKPLIWLGITAIFIQLGVIPARVIRTLRSRYLSFQPAWKTILLPVLIVTGYFAIVNFRLLHIPSLSLVTVVVTLCINFMTALVEESLYRGILYVWLLQLTSEFKAFIIVQILFLCAHIPILLQSGSAIEIYSRIIFIVILGVFYSFFFRSSKSLYASVLAHGVWNSLNAFFLLM